ncbi:hypothetical protein ACRN9V_14830 [Shewanella baltica]|uniref:hypothetical protein n=1 Tax=Shewanella baltica TaxID=62322 RepID=UPI003D7A2346
MSDETVSIPDPSKILPDFLNWIKPITLSKNRDDVLLRWKTIDRIFIEQNDSEIINSQWINNLILSALSDAPVEPEELETLRAEFKKDDFMYPSSSLDVEEELRVLSSYCLSLIADDDYFNSENSAMNTTKILSASFNGLRSFKGGVCLYNLLSHYSFHYSRSQREKPKLSPPSFIFKKSKGFSDSSTQLTSSPAHVPYIGNFAENLSKELDIQLSAATNSMSIYVRNANKIISILEEEQEVLWLVNLSWNEDFDISYDSMEMDRKILLLPLHLKDKTKILAELPSVKAIARKIGVKDEEIEFRDWVEKCQNDLPKSIINVLDKSSEITPVLLALKLATDGGWYKKWKSLIGIDSKFKINSLALTLQLYREFLTIEWSK